MRDERRRGKQGLILCNVFKFNSGEKGLNIREVEMVMMKGKPRFDVVFMDLHMPVCDGWEAGLSYAAGCRVHALPSMPSQLQPKY